MRSSTDIASTPGGNSPTSTNLWSRFYSRLIQLQAVWKWFTGLIQRSNSRTAGISPSRHFSYRSGTASPSASSIPKPDLEADFPRLDLAVALVIIKDQVKRGARKAPNLLVLPAHALEHWYLSEAVRYLKEQKAARQSQYLPKETEHGNKG